MLNCSSHCTFFYDSLSEKFCLPRRIFCPVKASGPVCVCDYQFSDEGQSEVTDRLKEMLDIDAAEEDLDTSQEVPTEIIERDVAAGREEVCFNSELTGIHIPVTLVFYLVTELFKYSLE